MRRITRPLRVIETSSAQHILRTPQNLTPCLAISTSFPAFSPAQARSFLLPSTQDKRKHQQFVKRWQKRLLGDSEPIGAHVDPYDPTSPVRIATEEQGDYEEVFDEDITSTVSQGLPTYEPQFTNTTENFRVGGEKWLEDKRERELAEEYEKLTLRTYTPFSMEMASNIQETTGSWYTLKDGNLLQAQMVHEITGRPYTHHNFGLHKRPLQPQLRSQFIQAVAEIYTLRESGLNQDISRLPNCGIYKAPKWVKDIELSKGVDGKIYMVFPDTKDAAQLLRIMQEVPDLQLHEDAKKEFPMKDGALEGDTPEKNAISPFQSPPQLGTPTMDPDTPAFKIAAIVKSDSENKPFDFMSNRPVPRAKPAMNLKATNFEQTNLQPAATITTALEKFTVKEQRSRSRVHQLQFEVFESQSKHYEKYISNLEKLIMQRASRTPALRGIALRWHNIPLQDKAIKFALFKRLYQLTGYRISDPQLTSARTLGDMYGYICDAARPKPTSLYSAIHIEGQKARQKAKQAAAPNTVLRQKANVGDLLKLGNVELHRVKPTKTQRRTQTGLEKVFQRALVDRDLISKQARKRRASKDKMTHEVLRKLPELPSSAVPMSRKAAHWLANDTREREMRERMKYLQ